jgi:hypothetical protein
MDHTLNDKMHVNGTVVSGFFEGGESSQLFKDFKALIDTPESEWGGAIPHSPFYYSFDMGIAEAAGCHRAYQDGRDDWDKSVCIFTQKLFGDVIHSKIATQSEITNTSDMLTYIITEATSQEAPEADHAEL